ncbi:MAG: hypothetical protein JXQ66_05640, partial [Campylobacterales bacterium]|nr:hypothetical protein [Campylobacterales bacterium]
MRVVSLINDMMVSESSSFYALHYAKELGIKLSLVHVSETNQYEMVKKTYRNIKKIAIKLGVEIDLLIFDNLLKFKEFVKVENIDIIFCSTKYKHTILDRSFAKTILRMGLQVDLAIVKVVKLGVAQNVEKIIMPIRGHHLSVNKFTFFTTLIKGYKANSEIFSIDKITKSEMASLDAKKIKQ